MDLQEGDYFKLQELNHTPTLSTEKRFFQLSKQAP